MEFHLLTICPADPISYSTLNSHDLWRTTFQKPKLKISFSVQKLSKLKYTDFYGFCHPLNKMYGETHIAKLCERF